MKTKAWAMAIVMFFTILPKISSAQTSDDVFSGSSENTPFEAGTSKSKIRSEDEIYYDTSKPVTPPFFDINSGIQQNGADPGEPPDVIPAPIDDYVAYLLVIAIVFKYRSSIIKIYKNKVAIL